MVPPHGPCRLCRQRKVKCSLWPNNPNTDQGDRHKWREADILEFRLKQQAGVQQAEDQRAPEVKKGKQRAHHASNAGKHRKLPTPVPSPKSELAALQVLNLESGGSSSAANTPADSSVAIVGAPLPKSSAAAASTSERPHRVRRPSNRYLSSMGKPPFKPPVTVPTQRSAEVVVEVPARPKYLQAAKKKASRSQSETSAASDYGSLAARVAALEKKQGELERSQAVLKQSVRELADKLHPLGLRL